MKHYTTTERFKSIRCWLLVIFAMLPFSGSAVQITVDQLKYSLNTKNGGAICEGPVSKYIESAVIQEKVVYEGRNYIVSSIKELAFADCSRLTSVEISSSVTSIGDYAFASCSGLTTVEIPSSVTSIGNEAFYRCSGLTSVEIPSSVTSIGYNAFFGCSGLTSVEIPSSVTSIGRGTFLDCNGLETVYFMATDCAECGYSSSPAFPSSLKNVIFGDNVKRIPDYAFYGCSRLTSVIIPNSVVSIGVDAFKNCTDLRKSAYPCTLTNPFSKGIAIAYNPEGAIVEDGFVYGSGKNGIFFVPLNIAGQYVIPESVTTIGNDAFYDCRGLTTVEIPNSVTTIGDRAFSYCRGLTSVEIPNSVTTIGNDAFYDCRGLTFVELPNSVTTIGGSAFYGCSGLTSVEIPGSVKSIGDSVFSYCSGLTSVELPNSVTTIGDSAFSYCSGLTSVQIPSSVTSIGDYAFSSCSGLTSFEIPNSVTSIGDYAFSSCSGLTLVEIPNSVTLIGGNTFSGCSGLETVYFMATDCAYCGYYFSPAFPSSLKNIIFGDNVKRIPDYAFYGCSTLTSVIIPNSVVSIGVGAFKNCTGLRKSAYPCTLTNPFSKGIAIAYNPEGAIVEDGFVYGSGKNEIFFAPLNIAGQYVIPESVTTIGNDAFYDCRGLTTVEIPNSVTTIGDRAFSYCRGLTSVEIPNSVTTIGNDAFYDCRGLTFVELPNSVTTIGGWAFYGCSGLASVEIPGSVKSIGGWAFAGCSGLTSVEIPNSVTTIGGCAFYDCSGLETVYFMAEDCTVSGYSFVFPSTLKNVIIGDNVKTIPGFAFYDCSGLTSIEIPCSVTSIGGQAFAGCSGLTSIEISGSVTSIGDYAFSGCAGLSYIHVHSETPPEMGDNSFKGLYDTVILSVPDVAASDYMATNWSLFKNLRLGDSCVNVSSYFDGVLNYNLIPAADENGRNYAVVIPGNYSELTEVMIPERFAVEEEGKEPVRYYVSAIGYKAFLNCNKLASVSFNNRNTSTAIGSYAFAKTSIKNIVIPGTVETIGKGAFEGCASLASIIIPSSVRTIDDDSFRNTSKLSNITLNEGLEKIGNFAFTSEYRRGGGAIYIPSTLKSIGFGAFQNFNCDRVDIADLTAWCNIEFGDENANPLSGSGRLYLNGNEITDLTIPAGVKKVNSYAFHNASHIISVIFSDDIQSVGDGAFHKCQRLSQVKFNQMLQSIGEHVFDQTSIRSVSIPGLVTKIGIGAFDANTSDLTFEYGADPIQMAGDAFGNITNLFWNRDLNDMNLSVSELSTLIIGNDVAEIPSTKFKDCRNLISLTLGNGLKDIHDEAFGGCVSLTEVIVPPSVENIGSSAFAGDNRLASIIMGYGMKTIGEQAFDGCPASTVFITAQTPPDAPNNTFSNYTGALYVQGEGTADAYYDAYTCWDRFNSIAMIEPAGIIGEMPKSIDGKPGDTIQLTATLVPDNVTLPHIFWRSTNPNIATVDHNGLVTLHADMSGVEALADNDGNEGRSCKIIAESMYANGPVAEVVVNDVVSSIHDVFNHFEECGDIDFSEPLMVFNLQGVLVADKVDNLPAGIYIIRQGKNVKKIIVK